VDFIVVVTCDVVVGGILSLDFFDAANDNVVVVDDD